MPTNSALGLRRRVSAGVPGVLIHDLRRSAVRNMEQAGVPRSVAMKLTGHKTENVYRRYAVVNDDDLKEAAKRIAGRAASVTFSSRSVVAAGNPVGLTLRFNGGLDGI